MIPFHLIYSWLFKSFRIDGETEFIDRLLTDGCPRIMIIKRSWIFALFTIWIPLVILGLSTLSIAIALYSIEILFIRYTIIGGNLLMSIILIISSVQYVRHFREIHKRAEIEEDLEALKLNQELGDTYFKRFFNWSITNQFILFFTIIVELSLMILFQEQLGTHIWVLTTDTFVMILEIIFLKMYRKRMMDLEMDYNIIVPGKLYFMNQSGVLSALQTIESDKIKTVRSSFPSKIASFFDYGTIDVLTEGDNQAMLGTMSMYFVTDPDSVVSNIQTLLDEGNINPRSRKIAATDSRDQDSIIPMKRMGGTGAHAAITKQKISTVLK